MVAGHGGIEGRDELQGDPLVGVGPLGVRSSPEQLGDGSWRHAMLGATGQLGEVAGEGAGVGH